LSRTDGSTFYLGEDDATFLWLDWGGIEGTRILEDLRLVQVEQCSAVLVLLVKVHRLQHRALHTAKRELRGQVVDAEGGRREETVIRRLIITAMEKRTERGRTAQANRREIAILTSDTSDKLLVQSFCCVD